MEPPLRPAGTDPAELTIRPCAAEDAPAMADLYNRQEAGSGPRGTQDFLHGAAGQDGGDERWVATDEGRVVGYATQEPAWWTGRHDIHAIEVRVERDRWGCGVGTSLFTALLSQSLAVGATRLLAWIQADLAEARRFAGRHGFEPTGQTVEEYRLYVPEARDQYASDIAARLQGEGIRIVALADIGEDESFLRALQSLWMMDDGSNVPTFETWRSRVLEGAGCSPRTHWVAMDGKRPVGTTFLKRLGTDSAENDYTAVAPSHRGRGLAYALKLQAIAWGREHGMNWFYTSSLIENTPMIAINRRLGYRAGVRRQEVARDLRGASGT